MDCGSSIGEVPKAQFDLTKIEEYDQSIQDRWSELRRQDYESNRALHEAKLSDWWIKYNDYLLSPHWSKLRTAVLRRDPTCQVCFNASSSQVHHVSYEGYKKFGVSFPVECCGVCTSCHESLHANSVQ